MNSLLQFFQTVSMLMRTLSRQRFGDGREKKGALAYPYECGKPNCPHRKQIPDRALTLPGDDPIMLLQGFY